MVSRDHYSYTMEKRVKSRTKLKPFHQQQPTYIKQTVVPVLLIKVASLGLMLPGVVMQRHHHITVKLLCCSSTLHGFTPLPPTSPLPAAGVQCSGARLSRVGTMVRFQFVLSSGAFLLLTLCPSLQKAESAQLMVVTGVSHTLLPHHLSGESLQKGGSGFVGLESNTDSAGP